MSYRAPKKDLVAEEISTKPSHDAQMYEKYDAEKVDEGPQAFEGQLIEADHYGSTKRGLKSRHIQLIGKKEGGCGL